MLEKTKKVLAVALGALVAFSLIYGIFAIMISAFEEPEIITADEAKLYMIDSNVVTNYTRFYYIKDCFENFVESAKLGKYNELYELYMDDYTKETTKEAVVAKLKEFSTAGSDYKLKKAYVITDGVYIIEYVLNDVTEEMFMQVGTNKGKSYQFALINEEE